MDDSKTVVFMLDATGDITGWLARARPRLIARCKEGDTDVYVSLGMPVQPSSDDTGMVRVRIDDDAPETEFWDESTDNKALFSKKPIELAKSLATARRLRLEVTPFNASPVVMQFNVTGFAKPARELEQTCKWPPAEPPPPTPIPLAQQAGRPDYSQSPNKDQDVYVYDGGTIYHRQGCVSLTGKPNVHAVKLGTLGKEYDPCGLCHPPK